MIIFYKNCIFFIDNHSFFFFFFKKETVLYCPLLILEIKFWIWHKYKEIEWWKKYNQQIIIINKTNKK